MATILEIVKRSFADRRERARIAEAHAHPLDIDLPLRLHIDGKIDLHPLVPEGMQARFPSGTHIVQAFARSTVLGNPCIRALLHAEQGDAVSYLWIIQDAEGALVRWFVPLDVVYPQDDDGWNFWISEKDGSIGYPAFQSGEGVVYDRLWQPGESQILPVSFTETFFPDRFDLSKQFSVKHDSMLYGRRVEDPICPRDELVLLSSVEEPDGNYVSIDIGIDLDPTVDMKVVY